MGYTITIGNAKPLFSKEDGELYARWEVEGHHCDGAPRFPNDPLTENSNRRSPSYTGWADTVDAAGIYPLFFGQSREALGRASYPSLFYDHPGCVMLTEEHHATIRQALDRWHAKATKPPGFYGWLWKEGDPEPYDPVLARLIWLEFWVRWALDNAETPAIENT